MNATTVIFGKNRLLYFRLGVYLAIYIYDSMTMTLVIMGEYLQCWTIVVNDK